VFGIEPSVSTRWVQRRLALVIDAAQTRAAAGCASLVTSATQRRQQTHGSERPAVRILGILAAAPLVRGLEPGELVGA